MEIKFKKQVKIILEECLKVKKEESVLIITDKNKREIADSIFNKAKKIAKKVKIIEIPIPKVSGIEPPKEVAKEMLKYNVILAPTTQSITHTHASRDAVKAGARVATLPGINEIIMNESMLADYDKVKAFTLKVLKAVKNAKNITIETKKGTKLSLVTRGRRWFADTGKIKFSGNLPAGEVFIAPLEGAANGKIIVDIFKHDKEIYAKKGTVITVEKGNVTKVSDKNCKIANLFKTIKHATNIAEFGIGTNYKAKVIGNILQDEKAIGTCHIAFGSNFSMGGKVKAGMHLDLIIKNPTIKKDGKIIMRSGKFS
ncbi:aminopeptidase [Candidatus Woesearchaeota archaeon]|nr:aminopeptidase [Candidatus Woesearchaeota archaeon]